MPTYEYACPACGIVEAFQSIKEKALTKCPKCHKHKVTRMVSTGGAVIFKGSGFWETDYNRSKDYSKKAGEEQKSAKPAEPATPPTAPQTQAKPATKKSDPPPTAS